MTISLRNKNQKKKKRKKMKKKDNQVQIVKLLTISLLVFMICIVSSAEIRRENYLVSNEEIDIEMTQGTLLYDFIRVTNLKNSRLQATFSASDDISEILSFESLGVIVESQNYTDIEYAVKALEIKEYVGSIIILGDIREEIPVKINVTDRILSPIILIETSMLKNKINPNSDLRFKININKLKQVEVENLSLSYRLIGESNFSNFLGSELINVPNSIQLLKNFRLPENIPEGQYVVEATAIVDGKPIISKALLQVQIPFLSRKLFGLVPIWSIMLLIIIIAAGVTAYVIIKRQIEKKKRYKVKLDYKTLPKKDARALWLGKIAETNNITYMEAERLMTHCIVAGATGGGKSIAAQVIIEEALMRNVCVMVFDPTAQWSGMLRKCEDKKMLSFYPNFGLKPTDARGFPGNIRQVKNARQIIDINKYVEPGHIQIFTLNKLDPNDIDMFIANVIRQVFRSDPKESPELKVLLVFDEVHRLLSKFGGSGEGFLQIERSCREFRKWGLGVMLISQVLNDFVGEIKANISTEIQMRTRDENDLNRIKTKYGEEFLQSLIKASIGAGMFVNPAYNHANPYFVQFRPILHNTRRLSDEELEKYNKYNDTVDDIEYQIQQLEAEKIDVFDLKMELKLIKDKIMTGNFSVVDIYLEGLTPRLKKQWEKLGKTPKKKEIELADINEIKKSVEEAKKQRKEIEAKEEKEKKEEEKAEEKKEKIEDKLGKALTFDNGIMVSTIKELINVLPNVDEEIFKIHVNEQKNDIASWFEQFSKEFSDKIKTVIVKQDMITQIESFIKSGTENNSAESSQEKPVEKLSKNQLKALRKNQLKINQLKKKTMMLRRKNKLKPQLRGTNKVAKKILGRKYSVIKKIKDKNERTEALKYSITSDLKLKKLEIENKINKMNIDKKIPFFAEHKLLLIEPKIKYFEATMKKKDYDSIIKVLDDINREIENV
jgi:hypothetical protein